MSASREKKQRQGGTPTDKTLTASQQADQTRRKTIQYTVIGVIIAILVAALLIWNSGFFQARTTAATAGGTTYSAAQTSFFYHSTAAYSNMMNYGQFLGYDTSKSPADQPYGEDGQTYHDYFMDAALEQMSSVTARYDAALADGMTAADVQDDLDTTIENYKQAAKSNNVSYKQYLRAVFGSYMTPSVFEDCLTRALIADRYQDDYEDSLDYTSEQLDTYYGEHTDDLDTFRYSYLYFAAETVETTDEDGNEIEMSDEERQTQEELNLAEAKAKADDAKQALEDGDSLEDVVDQFSPTSHSEDEQNEGSAITGVYADWLKSSERKAGDVNVSESNASGYYVVVFGERFLAEEPTVDTRHILVEAEMDSGASTPSDEQMEAAKAKAEELLNEWKSGAATEDSFAEMANANSDDAGSNTKGGLYEKVYPGMFVTNYNEWLFGEDRQPGDTDIVENRGGSYYGYHVVYFVKENPDYLVWMAKAAEAMVEEDTQTWLDGLKETCPAEQASGAKYLA